MLDLKTLNVGDKVRVINNIDNNVERFKFVRVGDIAKVLSFNNEPPTVELYSDNWKHSLYFKEFQFEPILTTSQSEDLIIYKSRWDEIIENLSKPLNCMTDEEVEIVKSVLKNNTPFNVVPNLVDSVIEKEDQTHLDANYVGMRGNPCFYYRSHIIKQWFWWSEDLKWVDTEIDYYDFCELLPVSFGINLGESK